jgi:hypothetical protein
VLQRERRRRDGLARPARVNAASTAAASRRMLVSFYS